jgi:hypothetical protein
MLCCRPVQKDINNIVRVALKNIDLSIGQKIFDEYSMIN